MGAISVLAVGAIFHARVVGRLQQWMSSKSVSDNAICT